VCMRVSIKRVVLLLDDKDIFMALKAYVYVMTYLQSPAYRDPVMLISHMLYSCSFG